MATDCIPRDEDSHNPELLPRQAGALRNSIVALTSGACFPQQVFVSGWSGFRFFESDRVFDERFVDTLRLLLAVEGARCACLRNLDEPFHTECLDQGPLFIDPQSTCEQYWTRLTVMDEVDGKKRIGWAISMDRFACTSEVGTWFIYCEKTEDLAVIAFRDDKVLAGCADIVRRLDAVTPEDAFRLPLVPHLASDDLVPAWRKAMLDYYGASRR